MFGKSTHQAKARLFRSLSVALLVAGLAIAALPSLPAFAEAQTVIPYGAEGYRYQQIGLTDALPAGFETAGFDDSAWATGAAGFGVSGTAGSICPDPLPTNTPWAVSTQLLVRKTFTLPARATTAQVHVAVDNDVQVWVNGHDVSNGLKRHDWCATRESFVFTVDDAYINGGGENLLAVRAVDRGIFAYLDVEVTTDVLPPYAFSGFQAPIDPDAVNVVRAGAAVPIKFSLAGDQGLDIFAAGSPASVQVSCDSGEAVNTVEETVTAGGSSLTYDALADLYTYVWKTNKAWAGTCRQLSVTLDDGTVHTADFQLK